MSVDVSQLNYVPTLAIRASEMTGLQELPEITKNLIQPVFLLAPWVNSKKLQNAIERIEKAFPNRPFFLDIDRYYSPTNENSAPQNEWKALLNPEDNYSNWFNFLRDIPNASPCVQLLDSNVDEIQQQVDNLLSLERSIAFRFELVRFPQNFDQIIKMISNLGTANHVIIIDAGWTNDTLTTGLNLTQIVTKRMGNINEDIPIVISYTSIPKSYVGVEGTEFTPFNNREVLDEIRRLTNRPKIIYGDWGSTRPRENSMGRVPSPRIDIATPNGWVSAKNSDKEWDYSDAANNIVHVEQWNEIASEPIWGVFRVKQTAISQNIGIHTAQANVASRVNMHLHVQALYDNKTIKPIDFDEDWQD